MIRFGIQIPHYGTAPERIGIRAMAELAIETGIDGLWLSDHIVLVDDAASRYPYADDGAYTFDSSIPWLEALTTLAYLAAATRDVELGIAVCVVPQREPLLLAKQLATVDVLAGGRVILGAGTGWLREEYAALGVPFEGRGERFEDNLRLIRACWTGSPAAGRYGTVTIPTGVRCEPPPPRGTIPVLVGGNSQAALRRAVLVGDGWLGAAPMRGLSPDELRGHLDALARACQDVGRDPDQLDRTLRMAPASRDLGTPALADLLTEYGRAGLGRITFDFGWRDLDDARQRLEALATTTSAVRERLGG